MAQISLEGHESGWWAVCHKGKVWLPQGDLPQGSAGEFNLIGQLATRIGEWEGDAVWMVEAEFSRDMFSPRVLLTLDIGLFQLVGRAVQLAEFYREHKFCGYCGETMRRSDREYACLCDSCRERYYPQIAPCIIVMIRRGNELLLAQHRNHAQEIHTALAGFVEVGETLEQAVRREVMEETQIKIKNIRYVSSQPWPFPKSLMTAFMADYDEGEIQVDLKELVMANFYHYEDLPKLPPFGTVARRLIEDTVALCRQDDC